MSDSRQKHIYKISSFENITFIVDTWMDYNELFFQHIAVDIKLDFVFTSKTRPNGLTAPGEECRYDISSAVDANDSLELSTCPAKSDRDILLSPVVNNIYGCF